MMKSSANKSHKHIKRRVINITLFLTISTGKISCLQGYVACELLPAILYNLRPSPWSLTPARCVCVCVCVYVYVHVRVCVCCYALAHLIAATLNISYSSQHLSPFLGAKTRGCAYVGSTPRTTIYLVHQTASSLVTCSFTPEDEGSSLLRNDG